MDAVVLCVKSSTTGTNKSRETGTKLVQEAELQMSRPDKSPAPQAPTRKKGRSDAPTRTADGRSLLNCSSEEFTRLLRNPAGVATVPLKRKERKLNRGPSSGTAGGDGPKSRRQHRDVVRARLGVRRPAVRRQELDLSWFQESNPDRKMAASTRDQLLREVLAARDGRPVSVGPSATAWLAREARGPRCIITEAFLVAYLRAKAFDALVQVTQPRKRVQQAKRVPTPVIAPSRRGAIAAVIEATLKQAENWTPAARQRLRERLLSEYGIRVTV